MYFGQFFCIRSSRFGGIYTHHIDEQGIEREKRQDVQPFPQTADAFHVFGKGLPVPRQCCFLVGHRDLLRSFQHAHDPLAVFFSNRSNSKTAICIHDGRDTIATGIQTVRIPEQGCIVVGVLRYETGRDGFSGGVNGLL